MLDVAGTDVGCTSSTKRYVATTDQSCDALRLSMTALYYSSPPASRGRSVRTGRQDAGHRRASLYHVRSSICDDDNNNNTYNDEAAVSVLSAIYTVSQKTSHLYNLL